MSEKVCKWCGREYDGDNRGTSGAGGWAACSESCRLNLQASVDSGATTKNNPTSKTGCLLLILFILGGYGFLSKGCSAGTDDASTEQVMDTEVVEVQPAESVPEAAEPEEMGTFDMPEPEQESQQEEVNTAEEEEVRIVPAPEEAEQAPSEEDPSITAF